MSKESTNDLVVIFCPPLANYDKPPADMSKCEKVKCPICDRNMWFSEKKKSFKKLSEALGKQIWFGCYSCFKKYIIEGKISGKIDLSEFYEIEL